MRFQFLFEGEQLCDEIVARPAAAAADDDDDDDVLQLIAESVRVRRLAA